MENAMHYGHDHHDHGAPGPGHSHHPPPGPGHNGAAGTRQWQTPHMPPGHRPEPAPDLAEPDLDLVETAFLDAFPRAPDPTSFLRLAGIPFTATDAAGTTLRLLRVEANQTTDVGTLTPHLGGGTHRYDPLPSQMTSRRATLAFVYFDGTGLVRLSLAEAKRLGLPGDT